MDINNKHVEVVIGKDEALDVVVYVNTGKDVFFQELRMKIRMGRDGKGLLSVHAPLDDNPDGQEYFINKFGLVESPML